MKHVSDGITKSGYAMVKRVIVGLAAVLCAPLLFAGGGADADAGMPATLRIGTEGYYPPFNYLDESGELKGFDIDIARALCAQMEVECEFVVQDWEGIIPALLENKYDAIVASMSITDERKRVVGFTDKYYSNQVRFVAAKGGGFDPAFASGKKIGAQRATIAASWLEENAGAARVRLYDNQENVFLDLAAGRLDAVFGDGLMLYEWLQTRGRGASTRWWAMPTAWTRASASRYARRMTRCASGSTPPSRPSSPTVPTRGSTRSTFHSESTERPIARAGALPTAPAPASTRGTSPSDDLCGECGPFSPHKLRQMIDATRRHLG